MRQAVFFDRDGVLNIDKAYVYRREDFEWIAGAKELIKFLNDNDILVIVITNQSGIARGYYTEENMHELHKYMQSDLEKIGAHIDAFYYCPHHSEGSIKEYTLVCDCRKPKPGLILKALAEWKIDKTKSIMIGDKQRDIEAAEAAGIKGYLFFGGNLFEFVKSIFERCSCE